MSKRSDFIIAPYGFPQTWLMADYYEYSYYPGYMVVKVVDTIIGLIEFMLALRLVLQLLSANPSSAFVAWVYDLTGSIMGPFVGAFPAVSLAGMTVLRIVSILFEPARRAA
jgi:hypothetical protein